MTEEKAVSEDTVENRPVALAGRIDSSRNLLMATFRLLGAPSNRPLQKTVAFGARF